MTAIRRLCMVFALALPTSGVGAQGQAGVEPSAGASEQGAAAAAEQEPGASADVVDSGPPEALQPGSELAKKEFEDLLKTQTPERLEGLSKAWIDHVQRLAEDGLQGPSRDAVVTRAIEVVNAWEAVGGDQAVVDQHRKYLVQVGGDLFSDPLGFMAKAKDWLIDPDGGIAWGVNLVLFVVILVAFSIAGRVVGKLVGKALGKFKHRSQLLLDFFVMITSKVIFFLGLMIGLGILGVPTGPFVAALGAAGFIIGFALQGTLSNFAAGIMILLYRPYDIGDYVEIAGVSGTVKAMTLVSTTLATPDNQVVVVPNGSIWNDVITNVTGNPTRRIDLTFGIGYDDDMDQARSILTEIVSAQEKVLKDPAPVIQVHALGDSSVNLVCRPWVATGDYWSVYWELTQKVKQAFDAAGISIPFPQRDIHVYQHAGGGGAEAGGPTSGSPSPGTA